MDFGNHLRLIRKSKNLTQKQVASSINITERNYQRYESGDQKPAFEIIISLCKVLDVSADYLLGLSDDPKRY